MIMNFLRILKSKDRDLEFGNGKSLKYFKVLFYLFVPWSVLLHYGEINSLYKIFIENYNGNASVFFFAYGNLATTISILINVLMSLYVSIFIFLGDKNKFSISYLLSVIVRSFGLVLVEILYIIQFPEFTADGLPTFISAIITQIVIFGFHYWYLSVRISLESNQNVDSELVQSSSVKSTTLLSQNDDNETKLNESEEKLKKETSISYNTNFCRKCGLKINSDIVYCPNCGTKI